MISYISFSQTNPRPFFKVAWTKSVFANMADVTCVLSKENFVCSICLDIFTSPTSLQCGHNFCKACIIENWRINRKRQCPLCKKFFNKKTEVHVNMLISETVAQMRLSADKNSPEIAQAGDVPCDICNGIKLKALKSCLMCLSSYCNTHLEKHRTVLHLKRHKLIDPIVNLEARICPNHNELMELFCKTDQLCVCKLCNELYHRSHQVVTLKEEFEEKKRELERKEAEFQGMIEERWCKVQKLRESMQLSKTAADQARAYSLSVFSAMTQLFETELSALTEEIKKKQEGMANRVEGLTQEIELEISELMKRNCEVRQLRCTDDHLHLLQNFPSLSSLPPTQDWGKVSLRQPSFDLIVTKAMPRLNESLCKETTELYRAELKRVQQYAMDVTLDPDTLHPLLALSSDGKQVTCRNLNLNLQDNPERFSHHIIVLGRESFTFGRFYFEVEVKGKTNWELGVASESVNWQGQVSMSPKAGYWTLQLRNGNEYAVLADDDILPVLRSRPERVGVFVDYEEGLVSFYDVDATDIIYSFTDCLFNGKLYPFLNPSSNEDGDNSAPLRICSVQGTDSESDTMFSL